MKCNYENIKIKSGVVYKTNGSVMNNRYKKCSSANIIRIRLNTFCIIKYYIHFIKYNSDKLV